MVWFDPMAGSEKTYWQSVQTGLWIGAVCVAGKLGAEIARGQPDELLWLPALAAYGLWTVATLLVVAALRAFARRKRSNQPDERRGLP